MDVLKASNAGLMWPTALEYVRRHGRSQETRAGQALVVPWPVALVYERPLERVIFDPVRDANPFFHLMESMWLLAGRDDACWLDQFVKDFSSRFAEDDGRQHGAYGKRWRQHWYRRVPSDIPYDIGNVEYLDQIDKVVSLLRANQQDRQAVLQMWDPGADLGVPGLKDRPCNLSVCLRADRGLLDIMVTCRSNDLVFGALGANVVHMSVLQEYLAARIGIPVGTYTQVSFNLHLYEWAMDKCDEAVAFKTWREKSYPGVSPLVEAPERFDHELKCFMAGESDGQWANTFFPRTAIPMMAANAHRREGRYDLALDAASHIAAPDWRRATTEWLQRRVK